MLEKRRLLSLFLIVAGFSDGFCGLGERGLASRADAEEVPAVDISPDQATDDDSIRPGPLPAELAEFGQEYERLTAAQSQSQQEAGENIDDGAKLTDTSIPDQAWLKRVRDIESQTTNPDVVVLPKLLDFAKRHANSPYAFDALYFVIFRGAVQTGDIDSKPWQLKEQALEIVWASHANDPRMSILVQGLAVSLPSQKTEAFLRRAIEHGPNIQLRAAAAYSLAKYYNTFARVHHRSRQLQHKEQLRNFERFWKIVITPYLEQSFPFDEEANSAQIDRLLHLIHDKYANVPAQDLRRFGPSHMFVELIPLPEPRTYGEMATAMMFELNNIRPGKSAPEIDGTDANGSRFRLSDYRGKVVLLTFTANWCGPCIAMHSLQRQLVDKYQNRPFVMLGISRDETIDTLKTSTTSGEITWRCWWDGKDGPINAAWNKLHGIPRFILLDDKQIIQNVAFNRFSTLEEFEGAIDALLKNVSSNGSP